MAEIEADIERTREQLSATLDEIADRVSPASVARRTRGKARAQFVNADGQLRTARVATTGVALVAFVALVVWRRRR